MPLLPKIANGDWNAVRRNFQKIGFELGPVSTPTFGSLTITTSLTVPTITVSGLSASRLIGTNASKALVSITDLTAYIAGVANEIDITDDGDGSITIGIVNPLIVTKGGTGLSTTTANQILYSSAGDVIAGLATANSSVLVTSAGGVPSLSTDIPTAVTIGTKYIYRVDGTDVAQADGGTAIDSSGVTNGQLLIGNTTSNVWALATLTGTANQVIVTNAASSITLSGPQDIATTSSPTFAGITLTGFSGLVHATAGVLSAGGLYVAEYGALEIPD